MPGTECVKVVVRVRPLSADEKAKGCAAVVQIDQRAMEVTVVHPKTQVSTSFAFNAVFGPDSIQQELYDQAVFPLVESVLEGYNGTIFAYGQTGCGKTFTMAGETGCPGVIPNSFKHIFGAISDMDKSKCFLVRCSYMEIYNEEIRDLLKYDLKVKLGLKESRDQAVFVKDLTTETVSSVGDMMRLMEIGGKHRTTKETMMNERSSRSHAIFTVYLEMSEEVEGRQVIKAGKLNLVDLAGSERQQKTQAAGERLREAIEINLSLSALGNVISALVDGSSSHIPYRDSKLTRLLQDSLGGNTKTIMIAVASPADYNVDESLSTLRYASRAKRIQNKPKVNEDPKDALLREYAEEIAKLKRMLAERSESIVIEKIVERERIIEKEVIVPAGDNSRSCKDGEGKQYPLEHKHSKVGQGDSVNDDPSPALKPLETKVRARSKAQIIEDDSSNSDSEVKKEDSPPRKAIPLPTNPKPGPMHTGEQRKVLNHDNSVSAKQNDEDEYEMDEFEEEPPTAKPDQAMRPKRGEEKNLPKALPSTRASGSTKDSVGDESWLRPIEERKSATKRTSSRGSRPVKADVAIRSSRSPAVRKPVRIEEEVKRALSRNQRRHPSTVNVEIAEVDETSEAEETPAAQVDVLSFIKEKLITGGQLIEETEQERLKEYHRLQLQLQTQKDRETALKEAQRRQEEDLLLKEKQYQSLAEEVEEQRKVTKALRAKYQASLAEVEALSHEREVEKSDLLESIRAKDRELAFFHRLVSFLLVPGEVAVVRQKSKYDEDNHEWIIPPFVVQQNKQTVFPKLQKRQVQEMVEKDLKTHTVTWEDAVEEQTEELGEDTLKKYQWLTKAEPHATEIDNRPPTSGHHSRQLISRHSKNVLLEPLPVEKTAPCCAFPVAMDMVPHATPLSKKRILKPHALDPPVRLQRKTSEVS